LRRFAQPENGRGDFFYFFARNPLKSPDSAKGIQGNPSNFAWFYLDYLAFPWTTQARGPSRFAG
jgi:hypothetical protein